MPKVFPAQLYTVARWSIISFTSAVNSFNVIDQCAQHWCFALYRWSMVHKLSGPGFCCGFFLLAFIDCWFFLASSFHSPFLISAWLANFPPSLVYREGGKARLALIGSDQPFHKTLVVTPPLGQIITICSCVPRCVFHFCCQSMQSSSSPAVPWNCSAASGSATVGTHSLRLTQTRKWERRRQKLKNLIDVRLWHETFWIITLPLLL